MHKKAQGLSLTTIVVAAIVLIILIVLVGIFTGYFSKFVPSLMAAGQQECKGLGYEQHFDECPTLSDRVYGNFGGSLDKDSEGNDKICCKNSCFAQGGECLGSCSAGEQIPSGNEGCATGKVCCVD